MLSIPRLATAWCGALLLVATVEAQETVYASFVLARTGERTPLVGGFSDIIQLTPFGANGIYNVSRDLRERYVGVNGTSSMAIQGLAQDVIDPTQLGILALDRQYTVASAQAFLQAFYPPTTANDTADQALGLLADGSVVFNPLDGYQYGWIHAASNNDPDIIFVSGTTLCNSWQDNAAAWMASGDFNSTVNESAAFYSDAGQVLGDDILPLEYYGFENAYYIADYLSFMNNHKGSVHEQLTSGEFQNGEALTQMLSLASKSQWARYGAGFAEGNQSVALVAGQSLASIISDQLARNVATLGSSSKLTLLFTEFSPFISFSALAQLPDNAASDTVDFTAMPNFGSQLILELYSDAAPPANSSYANEEDLRVRLLFRNGTDTSMGLVSYNMFGSSEPGMTWSDFKFNIDGVSLQGTTTADPNDVPLSAWCATCGSWASTQFCAATSSDAIDAALGYSTAAGKTSGQRMSNGLAGAIGAVATLCFIGLILFLGVGCLGWRVVRKPNGNPAPAAAAVAPTSPNNRSSGGGFKGGMKLESDIDLPSGAAAESGHGRVSSWEMKNAPPVSPLSAPETQLAWQGMRSRDADELSERVNPFADPVKPREIV